MKTFSIHVIGLIFIRWCYWYASSVNCTNDSWKPTKIFKFWHYFLFFSFFGHLTNFLHKSLNTSMSLLNMDSWTSNLSEIDRTVSCVPKYQSSTITSFYRVDCNLPPVFRLLFNVGKFEKCIKIHSNVFLDTLRSFKLFG